MIPLEQSVVVVSLTACTVNHLSDEYKVRPLRQLLLVYGTGYPFCDQADTV